MSNPYSQTVADLFHPCPLDDCNHSRASHNPADTETGLRCRAQGCPCGEHVVDLADEEWS